MCSRTKRKDKEADMKKVFLFAEVALFCVALVYAAATKFTNLKVTGTLDVDGASSLNGAVTVGKLVLPLADVATSTPTVLGQVVRDSSYKVYIGTNTTGTNGWQKVGTQS
jgi:hypothetical protein